VASGVHALAADDTRGVSHWPDDEADRQRSGTGRERDESLLALNRHGLFHKNPPDDLSHDRAERDRQRPNLDINWAAISGPTKAPAPLIRINVPDAPTVFPSGVQSSVSDTTSE
jgi:hypothetical protein